uniref:Putative ovule protein n=1 Tax=Solanum chacoense TaxID=4108 RepID=A0A0V0H0F4_SOLCH
MRTKCLWVWSHCWFWEEEEEENFFCVAQYFWKLLNPCVFIALFFPKSPTHEIHISHFLTVSMPRV